MRGGRTARALIARDSGVRHVQPPALSLQWCLSRSGPDEEGRECSRQRDQSVTTRYKMGTCLYIQGLLKILGHYGQNRMSGMASCKKGSDE